MQGKDVVKKKQKKKKKRGGALPTKKPKQPQKN
jgi:hypothetical protein